MAAPTQPAPSPGPPHRVCLIDGSGFIFRAFHALPPLSRSDGTPVNAVMGFCNMLMKLIDGTPSDSIACVFDYSGRSFRNDIYPAYKAHRPPPPEELVPQFPLIREAARAFALPTLELEGFEADDIIATLARIAREAGAEVTVVSSDKDLMQLVGAGVAMRDGLKDRDIREAEVVEKFGVTPDKVVDVQALAGDAVDNVPGAPGIGIKTAAALIAEHADLEAVLQAAAEKVGPALAAARQIVATAEAAVAKALAGAGAAPDDVPPAPAIAASTDAQLIAEHGGLAAFLKAVEAYRRACRAFLKRSGLKGGEIDGTRLALARPALWQSLFLHGDDARLSKRLVTLDAHVPLNDGLEALRRHPPDADRLLGFLRAQEFRTLTARAEAWLARLKDGEAAPASAPTPAGYELVQDAAALRGWIERAAGQGFVAIDTETTGLDAMAADLVGISLATAPGRACYIPLGHRSGDGLGLEKAAQPRQIPLDRARAMLAPLLADGAVLKIGHNVKFDSVVLARSGMAMAPVDDTMLLSHCLEGGRHDQKMDTLARLFLGRRTIPYKEVAGSGRAQVSFDLVPLERARDYAAEDADVTLQLWQLLKPRLAPERASRIYETVERPLIPVIVAMERAGIEVDRVVLERLSSEFGRRIQALETEIHALAGHPFTIGSPKQLSEVLFDELGLAPGGRKGKSGAYGTGADVLEALAAEGHDLPARVLDWRRLSKLKSTYSDALVERIAPASGRVHTSFSMAAASTGRLASTDPNLQNIPVRTEEGRRIRAAFVAGRGKLLLSADYSQIELRLLAHVAAIDSLKQAFHRGLDIHAMTAAQVFGVPLEGMDPLVRRNAKAINFGIVYGISAFGLARQLGIARDQARAHIEAYFHRYPGIRAYMERTKTEAREKGYVTTLFGRKCHLPGIADRNPSTRAFYERAAINAPLQGAAADIVKRAMIRVPPALAAAGLAARMLLQVHDELLFEVEEGEVQAVAACVKRVMEGAARLSVPLVVDTGWGQNWNDAH